MTRLLFLTCSGQTLGKYILVKPNGIEGFLAGSRSLQDAQKSRDGLTDRLNKLLARDNVSKII